MANTRAAGVRITFTDEELEIIEEREVKPSRLTRTAIRQLEEAADVWVHDMQVHPIMDRYMDDLEDGVVVTCLGALCLEAPRNRCPVDKIGPMVTRAIMDMQRSGFDSVA